MEGHVKALGVLHIVLGSLGIIGALIVMLIFGGVAAIVDMKAPAGDAEIAVPVLGVIGGAITILILVLSLPGIVVGFGLYGLHPWSRTLGIILSALDILNVPLGTVVGVYGLWVLLNGETERLFRSRQMTAAVR